MRQSRRCSRLSRFGIQIAAAVLLISLVFSGISRPAGIGPGVAFALGLTDQFSYNGGSTPSVLSTTTQRVGQTFTVGTTGDIDGVDIFRHRTGSSGDMLVEIYATTAGLPTGSALSSATVLQANIPTSLGSSPVTLPAFPVTPGTVLALVISVPGVSGGGSLTVGVDAPGTYAGGSFIVDGGGGFAPTGNDLGFVTYVSGATPTPTITSTPTLTSTATATTTATATSTVTATTTATATLTLTSTATATTSVTATPTVTTTPAATYTPTATGTPGPTLTLTSVPTVTLAASATPTVVVPPTPKGEHKEESERSKTAEQRQQEDATNRSNRDDVVTEGNVTEVTRTAEGVSIVIGNRDGLVTIIYPCGASCPTVRVGDYVQVEGTKENEHLYQADEVTISKN